MSGPSVCICMREDGKIVHGVRTHGWQSQASEVCRSEAGALKIVPQIPVRAPYRRLLQGGVSGQARQVMSGGWPALRYQVLIGMK